MIFSSFFKITAAVIIIALTATACSKTELTDNNEQQVYDRTEQKILDFKEKLKHADKSSETMSIDSAVWYIEAALNYSYCRLTENKYVDIEYDTITYRPGNEINHLNILEIAIIFDSLSSHTETIMQEAKAVLYQDVVYKRSKIELISATAKQKTVKAQIPDVWENFTEDWLWGLSLGKCDGTYYGVSDAAQEIAKKARKRIPRVEGYYTDIITKHSVSSTGGLSGLLWNSDAPSPNYCGYYILNKNRSWDPENFSQCVTADEMNFYLNKVPLVAEIVKENYDEINTHNFIDISMYGDTPYDPDNVLLHFADLTYGVPHKINLER